MRTLTSSTTNQAAILSSIGQNRFGSLTIMGAEKDELYRQILAREKEFVTAVPAVNISQDLEYLKIEFLIPGISKENCKLGNIGLLLWVEVKKKDSLSKKEDSFHWTFIIPENLNISEGTAYYGPDGKLIISIPRNR